MHALSIKDLKKVYSNGQEALAGINLTVAQGDFFALLGPNGAGKSTAIGIVCSLVNKTSGEVLVFGHDIDTRTAAAKTCIGLVPQEFNFNVFEPVIEIVVNQAGFYGIKKPLARHRAEIYLRKLGLWEKRHGIARELSGGMKRRLMIARALVHEPRLLILDEPTAGVDIEMRRSMWQFLREINRRGTTIILTTHYLEEAESLCQNIAIIDRGRIVENTSIKALLHSLNTETFILYTKGNLEPTPKVDGYRIRHLDENTLEVDVVGGQSASKLFGALQQQGVEVLSMKNKTNRLEQLFLSLVSNHGD